MTDESKSAPTPLQPEGESDLSDSEILAVARQMISTICKVRVIFTDHKDMEIWETEAVIKPGESITINAPTPESVQANR